MRSYNLVSKSELKIARELIYNRDNNTCQICNLNFKEKLKVKKNIDHIIPRSTVAWSHPFNLQLLCEICNEEKGSDVPDKFQKILENNVKKTTEWFVNQSPKDDSERALRRYKLLDAVQNHFFNFENHFDTFALYYDDIYINDMIGLDNSWSILETKCFLLFISELESYHRSMLDELIRLNRDSASITTLRKKARGFASQLQGLSYKLSKMETYRGFARKYRQKGSELYYMF